MVSQKCLYAIRALFDLAKYQAQGSVKASDIADRQAIPPRFLNLILNQLKHGGFVESRRGSEGGYMLAKSAASIRIGDVIRFIQGPLHQVDCQDMATRGEPCPLEGTCVFIGMWQRAEKALAEVYDGTTFQDMLEEDHRCNGVFHGNYSI